MLLLVILLSSGIKYLKYYPKMLLFKKIYVATLFPRICKKCYIQRSDYPMSASRVRKGDIRYVF
jgi:hypothetical protein